MNCDRLKTELPLYLYGELGFDAEEAIEQHAAGCVSCARAIERERALHGALDQAEAAVPPGLLASCRRELGLRLESARLKRSARWIEWSRTALGWNSGWWKPAGVMAVLAVGILAGRWQASRDTAPGDELGPGAVATRVRNVETGPRGGVQITVEETRQRMISGSATDDRIRRLLMAAAQDPGDPGLRVESVELLRGESEAAEVRRALIAAMVGDPNPGVRLKALEGLKAYAGDPEVRRSLSQVLLRDDNAGVRTHAVDLLVENNQRDMVEVLQQLMKREENGYIRLRTQRALREMNASVDSF